MAAEIYIVSGFLGAGKTTLIQKLLKEAFQGDKVVLIENDFGEISVDAALLKEGGVEVTEINSGCICCSLSGDFVKALREVLTRFQPEKIIIEPSGVGKLSDIVRACTEPSLRELAQVRTKITVADAKRCQMYLDNFGEFFEDQIQNADVVLLSRTEKFPDRADDARRLVKSLNARAAVLSKPWDQTGAEEILFPGQAFPAHTEHAAHEHESCGHAHAGHAHEGHSHDGHEHDVHSHEEHGHDGCCQGEHAHDGHCGHEGHDHTAEEAFDTVTIRTSRVFSRGELKVRAADLEYGVHGTVLRAKGILRTADGAVNLQYLPGDLKLTPCGAKAGMLCVIGRDLDRRELCRLFDGE